MSGISYLEETTISAIVSPKSQRSTTDPMMTGRVKNPPCPPPPLDDTDPRKQSWLQKVTFTSHVFPSTLISSSPSPKTILRSPMVVSVSLRNADFGLHVCAMGRPRTFGRPPLLPRTETTPAAPPDGRLRVKSDMQAQASRII